MGVDVSLIGLNPERLNELSKEVEQELQGEVIQPAVRVGEEVPKAKQ